MVRFVLIASLVMSMGLFVGCGGDDTEDQIEDVTAKANDLVKEIQTAIKDLNFDDAEKKLKELEGLDGLDDAMKKQCEDLRTAIETGKKAPKITIPKIGG